MDRIIFELKEMGGHSPLSELRQRVSHKNFDRKISELSDSRDIWIFDSPLHPLGKYVIVNERDSFRNFIREILIPVIPPSEQPLAEEYTDAVMSRLPFDVEGRLPKKYETMDFVINLADSTEKKLLDTPNKPTQEWTQEEIQKKMEKVREIIKRKGIV